MRNACNTQDREQLLFPHVLIDITGNDKSKMAAAIAKALKIQLLYKILRYKIFTSGFWWPSSICDSHQHCIVYYTYQSRCFTRPDHKKLVWFLDSRCFLVRPSNWEIRFSYMLTVCGHHLHFRHFLYGYIDQLYVIEVQLKRSTGQ